jgi:hypothetical protein
LAHWRCHIPTESQCAQGREVLVAYSFLDDPKHIHSQQLLSEEVTAIAAPTTGSFPTDASNFTAVAQLSTAVGHAAAAAAAVHHHYAAAAALTLLHSGNVSSCSFRTASAPLPGTAACNLSPWQAKLACHPDRQQPRNDTILLQQYLPQ